MSSALRSHHCPPWPTRLAVGLEQEVFYTKRLLISLCDSPRVPHERNSGSPASLVSPSDFGRHLIVNRDDVTPAFPAYQPSRRLT
jgi:hypothetical protein